MNVPMLSVDWGEVGIGRVKRILVAILTYIYIDTGEVRKRRDERSKLRIKKNIYGKIYLHVSYERRK